MDTLIVTLSELTVYCEKVGRSDELAESNDPFLQPSPAHYLASNNWERDNANKWLVRKSSMTETELKTAEWLTTLTCGGQKHDNSGFKMLLLISRMREWATNC